MATHYEQLLGRLPACSPQQRAAFLALAVRRAVQAFTVYQPGNPKTLALQEGVNEIIQRLPAGLPPTDSLAPLARLAEGLLGVGCGLGRR
jgi:hypothetical protein